MRLWTLHPKYLDAKGLVALWREALLAQKVLKGETTGYNNHPQLIRFRAQADPVAAIAKYLGYVHEEARHRGYRFDREKIEPSWTAVRITCTRGQLLYEWDHLKQKMITRDSVHYAGIAEIAIPDRHPLFMIVSGDIEPWEHIRS